MYAVDPGRGTAGFERAADTPSVRRSLRLTPQLATRSGIALTVSALRKVHRTFRPRAAQSAAADSKKEARKARRARSNPPQLEEGEQIPAGLTIGGFELARARALRRVLRLL